jgi:DNA-binding NarL/FixJ family response regulator
VLDEILELLARGERAAVIAEAAAVSLSTVRSQIRSILTKLEVNSQLEAAALLREDF